ncbi:MAG: formylglycine-generating enzyme family protein [Rhodospirillales bacterium]|nr:formylglycine-generating enzyme family protein [Rhodospirillales bacterium]
MRAIGVWVMAGLLGAVPMTGGGARAADRQPGESFWDCPDCPEMTVVPAGSFIMGADSRFKAEAPPREVTIAKPFAIGRFEVTFDQWKVCADAGVCKKDPSDHNWGRGIRPVININFADAVAYTEWLSKRTGKKYRLPTEAEWEYAARAGTSSSYSWGDDTGKGKEWANCRDCGPEVSHETYPVGSFEPNSWGLYDVHGNVWEWVQDCWNKNHEGAPTDGSARTDGNCMFRVNRSGSWYYFHTNLRSAYRTKYPAKAFSYGIGLRVVREVE